MANLPKFDRRNVDAARLAFSGSIDDSELVFTVDDEVTLVVKGRVTGVAHKTNQFGVMRRVHSISVDHAMLAPETVEADIDREIKRRADDESGQQSLDDDLDADSEPTDG